MKEMNMAEWLLLLMVVPLVYCQDQGQKPTRIIQPQDALGKWFEGNRAKFSEAHLCPNGEQVTGFHIQDYEYDEEDFKIATTGFEMKCSGGSVIGPVEVENVELADWSDWEECEKGQVVTGVNVRHDPRGKRDRNNKNLFGVAAVKMECSDGKVIGPDGVPVGDWARPVMAGCPASSKLCGFAAEVESYHAKKENVAINRIKFICCRPAAQSAPELPDWTILGQEVCFGGKNDRYGIVKMPHTGLLGSIGFVHLDGQVRCVDKAKYGSNFGCKVHHLRDTFSVFVTKKDDKVLFPGKNNQRSHSHNFYQVVGKSGNDAKHFELQIDEPVMLDEGEELRIWYGEDLRDQAEGDNGDTETCVNVYGKYIN